MNDINDIRDKVDRAWQKHHSNLIAAGNAAHDPTVSADELRKYADACEVSRAEWQAAQRELNRASGRVKVTE